MRKRLWSYAALCAVCAMAAAGGAARAGALNYPGLTLIAPEGRDADPGEVVSYCFTLKNHTAGGLQLQVSFRSEPDWQVLGEAGMMTVAAGSETVIPLSVIVPADAPAAVEHRLELALAGEAYSINAAVVTRINPKYGFILTAPPPAAAAPGASVTLPFALGNRGNVEDTYELRVESADGTLVTPREFALTVPPGETRPATVVLKLAPTLTEGAVETVTLSARSSGTGGIQKAMARITVGRASTEGTARVGEESLLFLGDMGLSLSNEAGTPSGGWLHLLGPSGADQRTELFALAESSADGLALAELFLLHRGREWQLKLGNFASPWTGLVYPGTGTAGLEATYALGPGKLELLVGTSSAEEFTMDPAWYSLGWSFHRHAWDGKLLLLETETGINAGKAPYLDASLDWRKRNHTIGLDIGVELGADPAAAGALGYSLRPEPFGLTAGAAWTDRINRDDRQLTLSLGGVYQWAPAHSAVLTLGLVDEPASTLRQAKLELALGDRIKGYALHAEKWREDQERTPAENRFAAGAGYRRKDDRTSVKIQTDFLVTQDLAGGTGAAAQFIFSGEYSVEAGGRAGLWTASLTAGASKGAGANAYQLDPATLRLGYADAIRDNLSYRIEVGYQARPAAPDAVLADLELDWSIGMDTSLLANAQAAGDSLALSLDLVHRVGLRIPRPHGTIGGVVFQDLDGDNRRGAGEPGIAGAWILLDDKRIARTDSEGRWTLQGVGPGAHTIEVECADPNMRVKTGPAAITLNAGAVVDLAVPVWQATVLTGCVFLDGDGDGLPGEGDAVIPGLPVILSGADGREETVNTARDGTFLFADLAPGPYRLLVAEAGLPPEAESPEPREVIVSQEGYLVLDLPLKEREKPVVFTYTASPHISADASPAVAMPGETVRLRVVSDMPLTKVSVSIPGAESRIHEAHGFEWVGVLEIPAGCKPGPLAVAIEAWADGGDPGTAEIELTVVEPLVLSASVTPDRVQPGGRVILEVGANQPLVAILVAVASKEILLNPREPAGRNLLVLPAHLPAGPAVLRVKARSRTGIEAERELVVLVDPGLAITALKLYPFDSGSSAVKPEFRPVIARLAEILKANPALNLMIVGHADASGTIAANDRLSWERAENVRRILIEEYGVDAGRLQAVGRGFREPIGDNSTVQGRELNRRVEFIPLL